MKKNLRRILIMSMFGLGIGKTIYAKSAAASSTGSLFSGSMKFVFAIIAVLLLGLLLYLSYKVDKEGPSNPNEGKVSKKKLGSASNKARNKVNKKEKEEYNTVKEELENDIYEETIKQSDFDSEEVAGFKDIESLEGERVMQSIDDLDSELESFDEYNDDYEDEENYDDYTEYDNNTNLQNNNIENDNNDNFNYIEDDNDDMNNVENNFDYDEIEEDDDFSNNYDVTNEYDEDDSEIIDDSVVNENADNSDNMMYFDEGILEDIEDYDDGSSSKNFNPVEEDLSEEDSYFDTSILEELDDYEDNKNSNNGKITSSASNGLANSNMNANPKSSRFSAPVNSSGIGFRNNENNVNTGSIGFRNTEKTSDTSSIGFRRKKEVVDTDNEKTTTKVRKKVSSKNKSDVDSTTGTTTKRKKI